MKKAKMMKKYAALVADIGINPAPKQDVYIVAPIEAAPFVRYLVVELYNRKARNVEVDWSDTAITKAGVIHSSPSRLSFVSDWLVDRERERINKSFAKILIYGDDPCSLKSVNHDRLIRMLKAQSVILGCLRQPYLDNEMAFCQVAVPTKSWAKRLFPKLSPTQAVNKLWDCIYQANYITENGDAIEAWKKHEKEVIEKTDFLNNSGIRSLHFKDSEGTDFTLNLIKDNIWKSVDSKQSRFNDSPFIPCLPMEEIYTVPNRKSVNGVLVSSKTLSFYGTTIENIRLEFKEGKVVNFSASKGQDILESIIKFDQRSGYVGKIGLVPNTSPLAKQKINYQISALDKNASCSIVLGLALRCCVKDGDRMSNDDMLAAGMNVSSLYVNICFGEDDLQIDGYKEDGSVVEIFRQGKYCL